MDFSLHYINSKPEGYHVNWTQFARHKNVKINGYFGFWLENKITEHQ